MQQNLQFNSRQKLIVQHCLKLEHECFIRLFGWLKDVWNDHFLPCGYFLSTICPTFSFSKQPEHTQLMVFTRASSFFTHIAIPFLFVYSDSAILGSRLGVRFYAFLP